MNAQSTPIPVRWAVVIVAAVLALGGAAAGMALWLTAPSAFTVTGMITVSDPGSVGYSDITPGTQVEVLNSAHEVVAVGSLEGDHGDTSYTFDIPDVPSGEERYGVAIGRESRGVIWEDEEEINDEGKLYFLLSLGL